MKTNLEPSELGHLSGVPRRAAGIRRRLRAWFDRHKRDLPWRRTRDPYAIWLSEMMLQQTQVATVIPYYNRFIGRFPTVADLAGADLEEVLRYWAGLGYYARARNMHKAARLIVAEHGGAFPPDAAALATLPGIGAYTAGAVASMAFDERAAVVDGNVARVLARVFEMELDIGDGRGKAMLWEIAERLLPRKRCGDFNQALMELGATVCLPRGAARCEDCPLEVDCGARGSGSVERLPVKAPKAPPRSETHVVAAVVCKDRWLVVRRPPRGLWGGLWELPTAVMNGGAARATVRVLVAGFVADDGTPVAKPVCAPSPFCRIQHQLTHRTITFVGHVCRVEASRAAGRANGRKREGTVSGDHCARVGAPSFLKERVGDSSHEQESHPPPFARQRMGHPSGDHGDADREMRWLLLDEIDKLGLSTAMRKVLGALRESLARDRETCVS